MKKGFTIIELLVVIALMFFLLLIIMVNINSSRKNSRDKVRIADISSIRLALSDYYSVCNQYPATLAISANNCQKSGITFGDFLSTIPSDPSGDPYMYVSLGSDCSDYHLGAEMEIEDRIDFEEDHDFDSQGSVKCAAGTGFDGENDTIDFIYDFRPFSFR